MRKSELTALVDSPLPIEKEKIPEIQDLISEYPYFTSAHLLLTKAYFESENLNFEKQLRLSAAYASDRRRLHDLIHQEEKGDKRQETRNNEEKSESRNQRAEINQDVRLSPSKSSGQATESYRAESRYEAIHEDVKVENDEISEEDAFLESQILSSAINSSIFQEAGDDQEGIESAAAEASQALEEEEEKIDTPSFNETEGHSFLDWIRHFSVQEIAPEPSSPQSEALKAISDQAKSIQKKAEFFSASKMAKLSVIESDDLVTETLAQVYETQGKYERAIQAYEKLQLKFPEKRVYFAGRIKAVEEKLKS